VFSLEKLDQWIGISAIQSRSCQIFSSAPYSQKPSSCVTPTVWETKSLTRIQDNR